MTGVFFELDKKGLQCVATDAHRLVRYKRKDVSCPKSDSLYCSQKTIELIKNCITSIMRMKLPSAITAITCL